MFKNILGPQHNPSANQDGMDSYLAPFTCADSIVVARGLVLADETGLVDPWGRWRRGWAGDDLLRACALGLHGYNGRETAISLTRCAIISSHRSLGSFAKTAFCLLATVCRDLQPSKDPSTPQEGSAREHACIPMSRAKVMLVRRTSTFLVRADR